MESSELNLEEKESWLRSDPIENHLCWVDGCKKIFILDNKMVITRDEKYGDFILGAVNWPTFEFFSSFKKDLKQNNL